MGQFVLTADDANLQAKSDTETEADAVSAGSAPPPPMPTSRRRQGPIGSGSTVTGRRPRSTSSPRPTTSAPTPTPRRPSSRASPITIRRRQQRKRNDRGRPRPRHTAHCAASCSISATQPGTKTYINNADKTNVSAQSRHRLHAETHGSQTRSPTRYNLNGTIYLTDAVDHNLAVDATGKVTALGGLDRHRRRPNPLVVGQTRSAPARSSSQA